jgi:hypothetical protein
MNLETFCIPVVECKVAVDNNKHSVINLDEKTTILPADYVVSGTRSALFLY